MTRYFLRIKLAEFQSAVRAVLSGNIASLSLKSQTEGDLTTLIGSGVWSITTTPVEASRQSVFACSLVMSTRFLNELKSVLPGQTIVNLVISREQPDSVSAVVFAGSKRIFVEKITLVGPGMISLTGPAAREKESRFELTRHSRILEVQGNTRSTWSSDDSILVVGAGSGGSSLALQVASNAPTRLIIIDPDRVHLPNLDNMPHASLSDASNRRHKSYIAAETINRNSPKIFIQAIAKRLEDPKVQDHLRKRQLLVVFSFIDKIAGHLSASILARDQLIPHIAVGTLISRDSSTGKIMAQADIRLFEPSRGCARCVPYMDERTYEEATYERSRPNGALRRGRPTNWQEDGRIGSSLALNQIAAGIAVDLFSRYLRGEVTTSTWIRYLNRGGTPELIEKSVAADPRCDLCNAR